MKTKVCTGPCEQPKSLDEFPNKKDGKDGFGSRCKECCRTLAKAHYHNNSVYRERTRKQATARQMEKRRDLTLYVLRTLHESGCIDCGETDPLVLEFDHLKDKFLGISQMVRDYYSIDEIKTEIAKCVVRCANCHRRKTAKERNYYTNINLDDLTPKEISKPSKREPLKLNATLVKEIREKYATGTHGYRALAKLYNVSSGMIRDVVKMRRWKNV